MLDSSTILDVDHLSVVLDDKQILRDISFTLSSGEALAVVGPNGAGKTVLFHTLRGAIEYSGAIQWRPGVKIGYVPQRFALDRNIPLTVDEFFLLKAPRFWVPPQAFTSHLEHELSIGGLDRTILKHQLSELSGGEVQRVLISWAMMGHPDVLLFDEPTAAIDVGAEENIYDVIERLRRERNTAVILISHDLQIVAHRADRVLCINREMIAFGTPEEVLQRANLTRLYGNAGVADGVET